MNIIYQPIERGVYRYNSDTFALYGFIRSIGEINGIVADIGSGSGILGILLAKENPKIELESFEIQPKFFKLTKKNSQINNIKNNCHLGNFLEISNTQKYDLIVSNPPFYSANSSQSNSENLQTSRYDNNLPIDKFISRVSKSLNNRGRFLFCYRADQTPILFSILEQYGMRVERVRFLYSTNTGHSSLVLIEARKNSKAATKFEQPLYIFSDEMQNIYKFASVHSILADLSELEI